MNPETRPLFLRCTADGKRFLMTTNSEASEGESAPVTVVLNWAAGLKKQARGHSERPTYNSPPGHFPVKLRRSRRQVSARRKLHRAVDAQVATANSIPWSSTAKFSRNGVLVAPLRVSYALLGEWALFRRCQGSLPRYGDLETQTPTHVEPDTRPIPLELPTSGLCGAVRSILRIGRDTSARESPSPKTGPLHYRTGNRIGGYPASSGGGRKRPRSGAYHQANAPPFRGF